MRPGCLVVALILLVAGCGGSGASTGHSDRDRPGEGGSSRESRTGPDGALPSGCAPAEVAALLSGLTTAVYDHDRDRAVGYLSRGGDFALITVYDGPNGGEGRVDSRSPGAAYESLVDIFDSIARREPPVLLATAVGAVAPRPDTRKGPARVAPTAGAEFVIDLGTRVLSGKVGIDCATRTIYLGAMGARPPMQREQMCGEALKVAADRPLVCELPG